MAAGRDETPDWIKAMEPKRESIVDKVFPLTRRPRPDPTRRPPRGEGMSVAITQAERDRWRKASRSALATPQGQQFVARLLDALDAAECAVSGPPGDREDA